MPQGQALQTLLGIMQIKQQREEADQRAEEEKRRGQQAGWQVISGIARRTADPMLLSKLASQGEQWGLGKASDILDTISQIQPDEDALRSFGAKQGLKAATGVPGDTYSSTPESQSLFGGAASSVLTGQHPGERASSDYVAGAFGSTPDLPTDRKTAVGAVMRSRALTGQGLTENASDVATSGIPDKVFQDVFSMQHGFTPTWEQQNNSQLGWAGLRSEDAYRVGQNAVGLTEAENRRLGAKQQGQLDPKDLPGLFSTQRQLLNDVQTNLNALTPTDKLARLRTLRGINQSIRAAGGYAPDFDEQSALQHMYDPSAWEGFKSIIMSKPPVRP